MAVRESLFEISRKLVQGTDTANVADHGDVLVPVACLVVNLQSFPSQGHVETAEAVLDVAVHKVLVAPVVEFVVAGVCLCLCSNTFRELINLIEWLSKPTEDNWNGDWVLTPDVLQTIFDDP